MNSQKQISQLLTLESNFMNPYKTENSSRTTFLTCQGLRVPKFVWKMKGNDGFDYTCMTKKGIVSHINRINKLLITNPELFN